MDFKTAKQNCLQELRDSNNCLTTAELIAKLGKTTIRCYWVDYVDCLIKDKQVSEKVAYKWGQII